MDPILTDVVYVISIIVIILVVILLGIFIYNKYKTYTNKEFKLKKPKKIYKSSKNSKNNNIKILHLVPYNRNNENEEKIYKLTRQYYELFDNMENITTYYYCFDDNIKQPEIIDDVILVPDNDSFMTSLDFTRGMDYDYVVNSNITTIVNFNILPDFLSKNNIDYGGSIINTYDSIRYISEIGIILSKRLVDFILDNKQYIDYSLKYDISIGKFIQDYTKLLPKTKEDITLFVNQEKIRFLKRYINNTIFYKNTNIRMIETIINKII